jgi:hypothetical protein
MLTEKLCSILQTIELDGCSRELAAAGGVLCGLADLSGWAAAASLHMVEQITNQLGFLQSSVQCESSASKPCISEIQPTLAIL